MFNRFRLENALEQYKQNIVATQWWEDEKYKWEAVK